MMKNAAILFLTFAGVMCHAQKVRPVEEAKGLEINAQAPLFEAINQFGEKVSLTEELKKGPVVLIFYRGEWCPVCSRYLSNLQDSLQYISAKGAQVLAVSPQKPEYLKKAAKKAESNFTLLHDAGYKIMDAYDVTFLPTEKQIRQYNNFLGADLTTSQSDESQVLPVPATFIISREEKIVWRQYNPDYKIRASVQEMLEHIP